MKLIYKIMSAAAWEAAKANGVFDGAPVDIADGFIHFSTGEQVEETASKHFGGQTGLLLIAFDADAFGDALKWEPSRGGELFPHLYAALSTDHAIDVHGLEDLPDGSHRFPDKY